MKTILSILNEKVSGAFQQCGCPEALGVVTVSDRPDLCQFQCNGAFAAAKLLRKAPMAIAADIVRVLQGDPVFETVETAGAGFINIKVTDAFLQDYVRGVCADKHLGVPQADSFETILLDYGGPNVAKPLHIGHLRSAVIGEALKRIVRTTGRAAIGDVHLGDWGLQIGLVIAELSERHPDWACLSESFKGESLPVLTTEELSEVYPAASKKSKTDEEFKVRAREITARLQKGHAGYRALWKLILDASIADIKANYERINVSFEYWYGESDAEKYIPQLMETLNTKGLLIESDGALVVDVSEEDDKAKVPPVIVKKADNSDIYATTDLATIIQRVKDFNPSQMWYIVDSRQSLHFTQVFRCAKKAGITGGAELLHLGFGTMNGADGKPYKTRDGGVMPLSELYDTVYRAALERVGESEFSAEDEKAEIARKIAVAAIKFGDLVNHRLKDYIFDPEKFLAAEGKTGSFLLYTVARINSILRKLPDGERKIAFSGQTCADAERAVFLTLALCGEAFTVAYAEKAPNILCENAYQLAQAFSKFYSATHIISEPDETKKASWVSLCIATKAMLLKHLDVLGIEAVELM